NPIMSAMTDAVQQVNRAEEVAALMRLRDRLLILGVRAELRDNNTALRIEPDAGMPVWVFVGYGGAFFSWQAAEKRHPVADVEGAAKVLADYLGR
ncbi:hypothetical protein, partial [Streptosporangium sp. KLBMP 9127]|nr:hypothetical protein [Streptosporangium sp. KLBMP 9127]